jgi:hypothetical protein
MDHRVGAGKDDPIKRRELAQRCVKRTIVVAWGDNVHHGKDNGYGPKLLEAGHEFMRLRPGPRHQDALAV